ncbi:MAG: CRISPR-associated endonuclease Cas3'' [Lachnospiraceae bacterium]|nr:CRISPR-associated endonuclease Cas3'' [Lachnospiraceae bacterium]
MEYYARSENALGERETINHHLKRTGELCADFLSELGFSDWGLVLGQTHDYGKFSSSFQQVLDKKKVGVNHALPGAALLQSMYKGTINAKLLGAVVASHHSELKSYSDYEPEIRKSYFGEGANLDRQNREYSLFGKNEYQQAACEWRKNFKRVKLTSAPDFEIEEDPQLSQMLFERFLFSALVDADWSSSAEHFEPDYIARHSGPKLDAKMAQECLLDVRQIKQQTSSAATDLNQLRDYLFDVCLAAGDQEQGVYTLTAPTGLGKTLSLLAFATEHCIRWNKRRIILILPFLTIIEQNGKDYREIIPELLEIHSNVKWTEDTRALAERWDAPCIVTTNVSFFEPLFSAHAGECRHLHQLSNSVIVLDEAQSLPAHLLDATLRTLKLLCDHYGCTVVFSTATQPSFQYRPGLNWQPQEIVPNPSALFAATRRVQWNWRVDVPIALSDLALELSVYNQCCVIVNTKRHARELLRQLLDLRSEDEVYYLSTDLCPAHRSDMLDQVRECLRNGSACCLVATSCVEAGVDIDFPIVYRALAPLDSIIQAAGHCNRNGSSPDGLMTVFLPDAENGRLYPTEEYGRAALCVKTLLSRHEIDCSDLKHIDEYYQLLYSPGNGDKKKLLDAIWNENYEETERQYRMIEQDGVQVIVPYEGKIEEYRSICKMLDRQGLTSDVIAMAKELMVSCFDEKQVKQNCMPLYHRSWETGTEVPTGYYLLGIPDFYDKKQGLHFEKMFDGIL